MYGRIARKVMYRHIATGLFAAGIVPMLASTANAACPPTQRILVGNRFICATPTTGAGTAVLLSTFGFAEDRANIGNQSCPGIRTNADGAEGGPDVGEGGEGTGGGGTGGIGLTSSTLSPEITIPRFANIEIRLDGTVPPETPKGTPKVRCVPGTDPGDPNVCFIKGVAFCSNDFESTSLTSSNNGDDDDDDGDNGRKNCQRGHRDQIEGPLLIQADFPGQTDTSDHSFTGARFQLNTDQQADACTDERGQSRGDFISFVAEEGFFTSCRGFGLDQVCQTLFCKVNVANLCVDEVRVYNCKEVKK